MEERLLIEVRADLRVREDRLDLRAEDQSGGGVGVVEGLDAEAVAGEEHLTPVRVPDREREHALEALDAADALLLAEVEDRLGVAWERKTWPLASSSARSATWL